MKKLTSILLGIILSAFVFTPADAQNPDAKKEFKKYINTMVEKVEEADSPDKKREILNSSLQKLDEALSRVEKMDVVSESDREGIIALQKNINEKRMELNGEGRFARVPNSELNNFADYVQQDLEQADRNVTISLTVALLIVVILLLL